jgi:hypothetical protein
MMQQVRPRVFAAFVLLSVVVRLVPYVLQQFGMSIDPQTTVYPWNFSPLYAICIFGAAMFADRRLAFALPLAALAIGDLGIGILARDMAFAFYEEQPMVYLSYALLTATGLLLRENRSWFAVGGAGLLGAVVFFLVSNLGVWAFGQFHTYPPTFAGLMECYAAAIPFFRFTLISMAVFLPVLFSRVALTAPSPLAPLATQAG